MLHFHGYDPLTVNTLHTVRNYFSKECTKFTTSGTHDVIAFTSPQKSYEIEPSHWMRSVYHLEELDSVVYF